MNYGRGQSSIWTARAAVSAGRVRVLGGRSKNRDEGADDIKRFVDGCLCSKLDDHLRFPPWPLQLTFVVARSLSRSGADDEKLCSVFAGQRFPTG